MLTVAVVGVGLIGGSLGQAWRRAGVARVIGVTRRQETIREALDLEAVDSGTTDLRAGVAQADVVVFCTPVMQIVPLARAAAPYIRRGALLTDVGSTKGDICRQLWSLTHDFAFIGGHPMAGSELTGVGAADPFLFENAVYCLTPHPDMDDDNEQLHQLLALVSATGARPLLLHPDVHDLIVAGVSHVPHIIAAALVNAVGAADSQQMPMLQLAAGGFRDTTRVASGPSDVWRDICLTNRAAILQMLSQFESALGELRQAVKNEAEGSLIRLFDQARAVRSTIPVRARGMLGATHELTLFLADQPGTIHAATGVLAEVGLNIVDIEIMRVREGEGGSVRLALSSEEAADRAVRRLRERGYSVRRR